MVNIVTDKNVIRGKVKKILKTPLTLKIIKSLNTHKPLCVSEGVHVRVGMCVCVVLIGLNAV